MLATGTLTSRHADALHNVDVDNDGTIEVVTGTLTLDQTTAVTNTGGLINVDGGARWRSTSPASPTATCMCWHRHADQPAGRTRCTTSTSTTTAPSRCVTGTLTLDQTTAVTNTGGQINVDGGATLALNVASITDGNLHVLATGTLTSRQADALHNVDVDNDGTIEVVTGTLTLDQTTAVTNTGGQINVDGGATLALDVASITDGNLHVLATGTLTSRQADALHNVDVDNDGTIEVVTGTLTLDQTTAVTNTGGQIDVAAAATLALNSASITDGNLHVLTGGFLTSDATDALHNVAVDNDGTITVQTGTLTLDTGTAVTNTGGQIDVAAAATLALNSASITDGNLHVLTGGFLTSDASDALHNVAVDNDGTITVQTGTLTLDTGTAVTNTGGQIDVAAAATLALNSASITDGNLHVLTGGFLTSDASDALHNVAVDNDGTITVQTGTLTLDTGTAVTNTGGQIDVAAAATLALNTASITDGNLHVLTGGFLTSDATDALHNVAVDNDGTITVQTGTLTLDTGTAVTNTGGQIDVAAAATLALNSASITDGNLHVLTGGFLTSDASDALHNVAVDNDGTITVQTGTLTLDTGTAVTNTGGQIDVAAAATLALNSASITDGNLHVLTGGFLTSDATDALHNVAVDNDGTITVQTGTLTLDTGTAVTNTGGQIDVAAAATLALNSASITDGNLHVLTGGFLTSDATDALHNVAVDNDGTITVQTGTLTLDTGTAVTNTGGQIDVAAAATLALNSASITDGNLHVLTGGFLTSDATDALHNVAVDNDGTITVQTGTLTLDTGTAVTNTGGQIDVAAAATLALNSASITDGNLHVLTGGFLTSDATDALHNVAVDNDGTITVQTGTLTLDTGTAVTNTGGQIDVAAAATLALNTASITDGNLHVLTGGFLTSDASDALHNVAVDNDGTITVQTGTLTLDTGTAVTNTGGQIDVAAAATLALNSASITDGNLHVLTGGFLTSDASDALHNVAVDNDGTITVQTGTLTLDTGTAVTNTGGQIDVAAAATLALNTASITDGNLHVLTGGFLTSDATDALHNVAVDNDGTITVQTGTLTLDTGTAVTNTGGQIDVAAAATLALNSASITDGNLHVLTGGFLTSDATDALHNVAVDNDGTITVQTGTLTLDTGTAVTNTGGQIDVAAAATLALNSASITDGNLHVLTGGFLTSDATDALHNVAVDNDGTITVQTGTLTLDTGTAVTNTGGQIDVAAAATLALNTASITDGNLHVLTGGFLTSDASDALHNVAVDNDGTITVQTGTLTLDTGTAVTNTGGQIDVAAAATLALNSASITDGNLHVLTGGFLTSDASDALHNVAVDNDGTITVQTGTLTLDTGTAVTNTGGQIDVAAAATLALNSASITDGNLHVLATGTLTSRQADALHNVAVDNDGTITVQTGTLTLDTGTAVTNTGGQIDVAAAATLALNSASITDGNLHVLTGGFLTSDATDALHNVAVDNDGTITVQTGTLTLDTGTAVTNTGGQIDVAAAATLALNSASITDGNLHVLTGGFLTSDATDALHNVAVDNDGTITVQTGTLTLDTGTAVTNTGGQIDVAAAATLALNSASITDGNLHVLTGGFLTSDATDALHNVAVDNDGTITVQTGTLTLDTGTAVTNTGGQIDVAAAATLALNSASITDGNLHVLTGGFLTSDATDALHNVAVDNDGTITVQTGTLTLDTGTAVTNTGGQIDVAAAATLALNSASITDGNLHVLTGGFLTSDATDALHNVAVDNDGTITVQTGTLTLDTGTAVTNTGGTIQVNSGAELDLTSASITGGLLTGTGTIATTVSGTTTTLEDVTIDTGTTVTVNAGTTLVLNGTIDGGGAIMVAGASTIVGNGTVSVPIHTDQLANDNLLTLQGSANFVVDGLKGNIDASTLTGTLTITTVDNTDDNTILITTGNNATSITGAGGLTTDTITVHAAQLANNTLLTLSGGADFVVDGLQGDISAGFLIGSLTVTTVDNTFDDTITITTGSGPTTITGTVGPTLDTITVHAAQLANDTLLTLKADANFVVDGIKGNIDASLLIGTLTVTTGNASDNTISIITGSNTTSVTDTFGSDTVTVNATQLADNIFLDSRRRRGLRGDLAAGQPQRQRRDRRTDGHHRQRFRRRDHDHHRHEHDLDQRFVQQRHRDGECGGIERRQAADAVGLGEVRRDRAEGQSRRHHPHRHADDHHRRQRRRQHDHDHHRNQRHHHHRHRRTHGRHHHRPRGATRRQHAADAQRGRKFRGRWIAGQPQRHRARRHADRHHCRRFRQRDHDHHRLGGDFDQRCVQQ